MENAHEWVPVGGVIVLAVALYVLNMLRAPSDTQGSDVSGDLKGEDFDHRLLDTFLDRANRGE